MKKILLLAMTTVLVMTASGCRNEPVYRQPWYDVYGYVCGYDTPQAGCNFYADGSKVFATEDPYYSDNNFVYDSEFGDWTYIDSYGYYVSYYGWAWLSPTGVLYDEYGYALNNNEEQSGRDLIADAAAKEEATVAKAGKAFAQKYALSEATGVSIARTLNQMATLPKRLNRARTQADLADFTKRLYGVDLERAMAATTAAQAGSADALRSMNADVAAHWGTQAETSEAILRGWYKDLASNL